MKTSDSITKLAEALASMQSDKKVISKSGENKFDKYSYAMLEDYIRETKEALANHGFFIITSTKKAIRLQDRTTKNGGTEHAVQVKLAVRLIHKSGEWIEVECLGEGQDRADKAIYKAITGARKYAIASLLGLATSDDPEADEAVGLAQPGKKSSKPSQAELDSKMADWIDSFDEETDINGLKNRFAAAFTYLKQHGTDDNLAMIKAAYDHKKTELGLYAQAGVTPQ